MTSASWHHEVGKRVGLIQITVGAMAAGALVFLAVAIGLRGLHQPLRWHWTPMTLILAGCAGAAIVASLTVPTAMVRSGRRAILDGQFPIPQAPASEHDTSPATWAPTDDAHRLMLVFQGRTILAAAVAEGVGCFAIVTYMVEGSGFALGLAILAIVAILVRMPTRSAAIHWIENQLHLMEQERAWERPG